MLYNKYCKPAGKRALARSRFVLLLFSAWRCNSRTRATSHSSACVFYVQVVCSLSSSLLHSLSLSVSLFQRDERHRDAQWKLVGRRRRTQRGKIIFLWWNNDGDWCRRQTKEQQRRTSAASAAAAALVEKLRRRGRGTAWMENDNLFPLSFQTLKTE